MGGKAALFKRIHLLVGSGLAVVRQVLDSEEKRMLRQVSVGTKLAQG